MTAQMWNTCHISRMSTFDKILDQLEQKKTTPPCIIFHEAPNVCTLKHVANYFVFDFLAASQLEEKAESLKQQMINKRHVFFD